MHRPLGASAVLSAVLLAVSLLASGPVDAAGGGSIAVSLRSGAGLSVTSPNAGQLSVPVNGRDRVAYATLGSFTVSDTTGSGRGWHLQISATQLACSASGSDDLCPAGGAELPLDSMAVAPPTVTCQPGNELCSGRSAPPTVSIASDTAIDTGGTAVTLASAAINTGMGVYDFTPGSHGAGQLIVTIPAGARRAIYRSTLTVTIVTGP